MFWRQGTRAGALTGLTLGFVVWAYTLLLPSFAKSGWLPISFIEQGPFGIALLKPLALFGLAGLDDISHAMFWSMLANAGGYVAVSLLGTQSIGEHAQALLFVDVFRMGTRSATTPWRGSASVQEIVALVARFLGERRTADAFAGYARQAGVAGVEQLAPD